MGCGASQAVPSTSSQQGPGGVPRKDTCTTAGADEANALAAPQQQRKEGITASFSSKELVNNCAAAGQAAPEEGNEIGVNQSPIKESGVLEADPVPETCSTGTAERPTGLGSRPAHHISKAAVSLGFLQRFVEEKGVRQQQLTTAQLVYDVIKPITAASKSRYTDLMLADPNLETQVSQGRPFYFISHAWGRRFTDTLDMVAHHFEPRQQLLWRRQGDGQALPPLGPDEVFVWFDMFAINQHQSLAADDSDLASLWAAVQDAEETLMVLDAEGALLTRIWCLYEAWQSNKVGAEKLRLLSYNIQMLPLEKVFIGLDVSHAQATVQTDRDRILEDIRRDVGSLDDMTHRLKDALVAGAMSQVPPEDIQWDEDIGDKVATAARLCQVYGKFQKAEHLYQRNLAAARGVLGPEHRKTVAAIGSLAGLYVLEGRRGEGEQLFRQALEMSERVLGPDHANTLNLITSLASVLQGQQSNFQEAEELHRRAVERLERTLGPDDPSALTATANLAELVMLQGRLQEALVLCRRAYEGLEKLRGQSHPDTLMVLTSLSGMLMAQGNFEEAEVFCRKAREGSERVLGRDHRSTLSATGCLGTLLRVQGKYEEAEVYNRQAWEGSIRSLGPEHQDTLGALGLLAGVLQAQGKNDEAEVMYKQAYEGCNRVLGPEHMVTLSLVPYMVPLLQELGKLDEAEVMAQESLEHMEKVLGHDHPLTVNLLGSLVTLLELQGKVEEAESVLKRADAGGG